MGAGRALREQGYLVGLTAQVGPHLFAGVRYDFYDPDRDASEVRNGTQVVRTNALSTTAVVLGARLPPYGRVMVEYDHNTNALARTTSGAPTTLPDDALTVRGEVVF